MGIWLYAIVIILVILIGVGKTAVNFNQQVRSTLQEIDTTKNEAPELSEPEILSVQDLKKAQTIEKAREASQRILDRFN